MRVGQEGPYRARRRHGVVVLVWGLALLLPIGPALALAASHESCCDADCEGEICHLDLEKLSQRAARGEHAKRHPGASGQVSAEESTEPPSCHTVAQPVVVDSPQPVPALVAPSECCDPCPPATAAGTASISTDDAATARNTPGGEAVTSPQAGHPSRAAHTSANPRAPPPRR